MNVKRFVIALLAIFALTLVPIGTLSAVADTHSYVPQKYVVSWEIANPTLSAPSQAEWPQTRVAGPVVVGSNQTPDQALDAAVAKLKVSPDCKPHKYQVDVYSPDSQAEENLLKHLTRLDKQADDSEFSPTPYTVFVVDGKGNCGPDNNWKYKVDCTGVSGNNPNKGDSVDSNVRITNLVANETRTFNYHGPDNGSGGSFTWTYYDQYKVPRDWTYYRVEWVQVHTTNYHWEEGLTCGKPSQTPTPPTDTPTPPGPTCLPSGSPSPSSPGHSLPPCSTPPTTTPSGPTTTKSPSPAPSGSPSTPTSSPSKPNVTPSKPNTSTPSKVTTPSESQSPSVPVSTSDTPTAGPPTTLAGTGGPSLWIVLIGALAVFFAIVGGITLWHQRKAKPKHI